jgi:hypothetical protein
MHALKALEFSEKRFFLLYFFSALVLLLLAVPSTRGAPQVATFQCDATPPKGEPLVWATNLIKVESPLLAKGVLLEDGGSRDVLCVIDWCLLGNESRRTM